MVKKTYAPLGAADLPFSLWHSVEHEAGYDKSSERNHMYFSFKFRLQVNPTTKSEVAQS